MHIIKVEDGNQSRRARTVILQFHFSDIIVRHFGMGAEQSARLVCTETGEAEKPLKLINSELFFRLYFDRMREPVTGPVTEALFHLVKNLPKDRAVLNG